MAIDLNLDTEMPPGSPTDSPIILRIAAGTDVNGDGELRDTSVAQEVHKLSPWYLVAVSKSRYDLQRLLVGVGFHAYGTSITFADKFALSFVDPQGLQPILGVAPEVIRLQDIYDKWSSILAEPYTSSQAGVFDPATERDPLSHHVGIDYRSGSNGLIGRYRFPASSALAVAIRESDSFRAYVLLPAVRALGSGLAGPRKVAFRFDNENSEEVDLHGTLGTVYVSAEVTADIACSPAGQVLSNVALVGSLFDVYDWNYSVSGGVPFYPEIFKQMASIQAGYGTLGNAGQVFQVDIDLGTPLPEFEGLAIGSGCAPPSPRRLNDTGVTFCRVDGSAASCVGTGQDGEFGRDVSDPDPADGHSGFSFTKIGSRGQELPNSARLGSGDDDWACTRDNVTGLIWEVKQNVPGLRYYRNTYTNYGDRREGDLSRFVEDVSLQGLCGAVDWRIPTALELGSIVDYGTRDPIGDGTAEVPFFPNSLNSNQPYWTSTPASTAGSYVVIRHRDGQYHSKPANGIDFATGPATARLVRGAAQAGPRFRPRGDEVYDAHTGLVWQRCAVGQRWSGEKCEGEPVLNLSWSAALSLARQAAPWRVPNLKELLSLTGTFAIAFPGIPGVPYSFGGVFWTSTPVFEEQVFVVSYIDNMAGFWWSSASMEPVGHVFQLRLVRDAAGSFSSSQVPN